MPTQGLFPLLQHLQEQDTAFPTFQIFNNLMKNTLSNFRFNGYCFKRVISHEFTKKNFKLKLLDKGIWNYTI